MREDNALTATRTPRSAARRQHLLDTARNLFVDRGFHQTGMAQIASESGIAVGQIYRDFANKEAIIAAICEADLAAWLEEENLAAAVAAGDVDEIRCWLERITTEEPSFDDRRLMCELLAEIGRNPIVSEINHHAADRIRASLGTALDALAPGITAERRGTMIDFIVAIAWGMMAGKELMPDSDHAALQRYVAKLLYREVAALTG